MSFRKYLRKADRKKLLVLVKTRIIMASKFASLLEYFIEHFLSDADLSKRIELFARMRIVENNENIKPFMISSAFDLKYNQFQLIKSI